MKLPAGAFRFDFATISSFAADDKEADPNRRPFKGNAHTGKPMQHYLGNVAVDLKSMRFNRKDLPVLRDHDGQSIVGFTSSIKKTDAGVEVEGQLVGVTAAGREVIDLLDAGVPMQMSVYVPPTKILRLAEGESAEVNGHTVNGPGAVLYGTTLREVTITALGADDLTKAALLSSSDAVEVEEETLADREQNTETKTMTKKTEDGSANGAGGEEKFDAAQIRADAIKSERERVAFITSKSAGRGIDPKLVQKAIDEGWSREQAATEFLDAIAERKEARLETIRKATPDASGGGNGDDELGGEERATSRRAASGDSGETSFKAPAGTPAEFLRFESEWRGDAELRERFGDSFERFAATRAADEGLIFYRS